MKKLVSLFLVILLFESSFVLGQENLNLKQETIEFDFPKSIFFSGEKLWISLEVSTIGTSTGSQIAYVELLNREGESVALGKFQLDDGKAINFLQIPDNLVSDNYLLRAFTRVSPYLDLDKGLRQSLVTIISPRNPPRIVEKREPIEIDFYSGFELINPKGTSDEFKLELDALKGEFVSASVSVVNPFLEPHENLISSEIYKGLEPRALVPELFGHLVEGYVNPSAVDTTQLYFLSVHGDKSALFTDRPDKNGALFFDTGGIKEWDFIIAQTNGNESLIDFSIVSPSPKTTFSEDFEIPELVFSPEDKSFLEKLLKAGQIESYFLQEFEQKEIPIVTGFVEDQTYFLDDYTRFEDVETVIKEYVPEIGVKTVEKRKEFRVLDKVKNRVFDSNPLMLIDAMPVFDSDKLSKFDPTEFEKLEILTRSFYLNEEAFSGVMSFTSFENDFADYPIPSNGIYLDYPGIAQRVTVFPGLFSQSEEERIPELRTIHYWSETEGDFVQDEISVPLISSDFPMEIRVKIRNENGELETLHQRIETSK